MPTFIADSQSGASLVDRLDEAIAALAQRCSSVSRERVAAFSINGESHEISRLVLRGAVESDRGRRRIGIFALLHGDEPAGAFGLVTWLARWGAVPVLASGYEVYAYPICNPTAFRAGVRENHGGHDLNREFWRDSRLPEVVALEGELRRHAFDGVIALHADDTSPGVYGYSQGKPLNGILLGAGLAAAERWLPRNRSLRIDSFPARRGFIEPCFTGILAPPPEQTPRPFEVIFETPALAPLDLQVEATAAALEGMLTTLRYQNVLAADI